MDSGGEFTVPDAKGADAQQCTLAALQLIHSLCSILIEEKQKLFAAGHCDALCMRRPNLKFPCVAHALSCGFQIINSTGGPFRE